MARVNHYLTNVRVDAMCGVAQGAELARAPTCCSSSTAARSSAGPARRARAGACGARRQIFLIAAKRVAPASNLRTMGRAALLKAVPASQMDIAASMARRRRHRAAYTDPAVFALEQERIFRRTPGSTSRTRVKCRGRGVYVLRRLGPDEVLLVRGEDGGLIAAA